MPKVSIVIPIYNAERTIKRCLESIAAQTYADFEVLCVDDGSHDGSGQIVDAFCRGDGRFRVVHQANAGAAAARNAGMQLAQGEFVTFVDADDTLPKKALQFMHQSTVINDCDTVMGMYERVDGMSAYTNSRSANLMNKTRRVQPDDLDIIHTWTLCNKWFSRRIIEDNALRLEAFRHLEDATFLYKYLRFANKIYTCPHVVYTYYKPLPITGRTTTQSVDLPLLESAEEALRRLEALTSGYSVEFREELRYRFLNSPLIGDYYRRFWKLDDACFERVQQIARELFDGLGDEHRGRIVDSHFDIFDSSGAIPKGTIIDEPMIAIAIGPGVSRNVAASLIEGLYDQTFVPFRLLLDSSLRDCVPGHLEDVANLRVVDTDVFEAARNEGTSYCAFVDFDMVYDHRSLMTMARTLKDDESLDCVALGFKELDADGNEAPEDPASTAVDVHAVLGNKLFRTSAIREASFDDLRNADTLACKELSRPVVVHIVAPDEIARRKEAVQKLEAEKQKEIRKKRNPLRRAKRKLGRMIRGEKPKKKTPPKRKTVDFFLDEEVDPYLIVLEGLGKRPKGNMLYILRELHKPEYAAYRIAFSITEDTRAETERIMAREGFGDVQLVVAGSDDYKLALFTAGYLFNEVDFPNWWIKKAGQIYTNIWHGTPLKTLGKAKVGAGIGGANASRNFAMADYLLFPNEHTRRCLLEDCDVKQIAYGEQLMLGYPRTGALYDTTAAEALRMKMELTGCEVLAWMPTYRESLDEEHVKDFLRSIDGLLGASQKLYVNMHHRSGINIDNEIYEHICTFPDDIDMYELLACVDVLITDYSSVLFDFAVTGRKILLFCPDLEQYVQDRGLYIDMETLPFCLVRTAEDLVASLEKQSSPTIGFSRLYNAYDSCDNVNKLCRIVLNEEDAGVVRYENESRNPICFVVSDSLRKTPENDMLYEMLDAGLWRDDMYLSFIEKDTNEHHEGAFPLVHRVHTYATKGSPLNERTEEERLFGGINIDRIVIVDTVSPNRIQSFARFHVPVYLFIRDEIVEMVKVGDDDMIKAIKLFDKWGNGMYSLNAEAAEEMQSILGIHVEYLKGPLDGHNPLLI